MRYSRSRFAVVEVLADAGRPVTLREILVVDGGRRLAQSSAYRNLAELVDLSLIHI